MTIDVVSVVEVVVVVNVVVVVVVLVVVVVNVVVVVVVCFKGNSAINVFSEVTVKSTCLHRP